MLHVYKIDSFEIVDEPFEDILENEGRSLFDVFVKNVDKDYFNDNKIFPDQYEGGWPIAIQNNDEWGFCVNDYAEFDWHMEAETLKDRGVGRHFFIRLPFNKRPKTGSHFAFLNQYDKRLTNEEIIETVNNCQSDDPESVYEIGIDNKLHLITPLL